MHAKLNTETVMQESAWYQCLLAMALNLNPFKEFLIVLTKKLIARITELFTQKLQWKTGWGRNEILALHAEAVTEAIMETLE